jgi:hypothetical protein
MASGAASGIVGQCLTSEKMDRESVLRIVIDLILAAADTVRFEQIHRLNYFLFSFFFSFTVSNRYKRLSKQISSRTVFCCAHRSI